METTLSSPEHTPWHVDERSGAFDIRTADRLLIASLGFNPNYPKSDPHYRRRLLDARLVAAAPQLLRELKHAVQFLERIDPSIIEGVEAELDMGLAPENLLAAIDAALGR